MSSCQFHLIVGEPVRSGRAPFEGGHDHHPFDTGKACWAQSRSGPLRVVTAHDGARGGKSLGA